MNLLDDARNLLSLADWRNVNIGLRDGERTRLFVRRPNAPIDVVEIVNDESKLKDEENALQGELHYIEAVEQRNEAQILSFIDERHQWESQSQEDRDMLLKKPQVVARLEVIRRILNEKSA